MMLLITSRSTEDWLGDIRRISLGGLPSQEAAEYAEDLLKPYPQARARRSKRSYAELVEWLDGHPLSMRLILPQLEDNEPDQLLEALEDHGALPTGFESDAGRTESLAVSVHYSLIHLDDATRRLLAAASLFEGVVYVDALTVFSETDGVPDRFQGISQDEWVNVMETTEAVGLMTELGGGMFTTHPALGAYLTAQWRHENPDTYETE